jgi:hypothetical protein
MGGACSKYGGRETVLAFGGAWKNTATLKGNIMCILQTWREDMKWIDMAQDCDKWQAVVSTVMNIWVPYTAENLVRSRGTL